MLQTVAAAFTAFVRGPFNVAGALLQLVGLLALLHWSSKAVIALIDRAQARSRRSAALKRLYDERATAPPSAFPRLEPEIEALRSKGAL